MTAPSTARELIDHGEARLRAAGIDTPRLDAELLLAEAAGTTRSQIVAGLVDPTRSITTYEAWLRRRVAREPLAYITGRQGFRRIDLNVDARVLIPRPETELLVAVMKVDDVAGDREAEAETGAVRAAVGLAEAFEDVREKCEDEQEGKSQAHIDALMISHR